jgi:hypothetical protein
MKPSDIQEVAKRLWPMVAKAYGHSYATNGRMELSADGVEMIGHTGQLPLTQTAGHSTLLTRHTDSSLAIGAK